MTEEEIDVFLAHYGVKGMKWGHRKQRDRSDDSGPSTKKKIAVGVGVTVGIGAAVAVALLARNSGMKASQVPTMSPELRARALAAHRKAVGTPWPTAKEVGSAKPLADAFAERRAELAKMTTAQLIEYARTPTRP